MESEDLLGRLDEIEARMKASSEALKRGLREQGAEMQLGFAENREAIQALARSVETLSRTQERQETRFTAWLEGVEARLDEHQDSTKDSFHMLGGIVRTWLNRHAQEAETLRADVRDHEARLRALEQGRSPAA